MGDGERFSLDAMASSPGSFLAAFDRQHVEPDEALRGWLVDQANGATVSEVLTVVQAAAVLQVNPETVRRRVRRGELATLPRSGPTAPMRILRSALGAAGVKPRITPRPAPVKSAAVEWPK
jgi:hypothetical protein